MTQELTTAPVLSTPDTHILSEDSPKISQHPPEKLSDDQIYTRYEISRTITEIKQHRWRRVALQFPDQMLPHSARVYQFLARGLVSNQHVDDSLAQHGVTPPESDLSQLSIQDTKPVKLTILGDTSYGSCCVDEIAAEHVNADAVVHYGRSCLSPTARLPVLHIFTKMELEYDAVVNCFRNHFPELDTKVILTADVPYALHVQPLAHLLESAGYTAIFAASIIHDPSSSIPNRTIPYSITSDPSSLSEWHLFHISDPPTSLLLTLISRMSSIKIFPTISSASLTSSPTAIDAPTQMLLRRRYALITSLTTTSTWGILINTLSVKNYLSILSHIQRLIAEAGKKSYLFVVGKLNAAKIANFSEIGGWVVIGCWESSLIDSKEFYRPIITPFELELVLQRDDERVWTGQWRSDFEGVLETAASRKAGVDESTRQPSTNGHIQIANGTTEDAADHDASEESESEPPEFDLRTGRYVSRTRPMHSTRSNRGQIGSAASQSTALAKRSKGDMITVNGISSPAADYLSQNRTWKGLGSDFEVKYEDEEIGGAIEEGRTGVARGYTVGESSTT
jgi:diphthamide biosynthesis protein 2